MIMKVDSQLQKMADDFYNHAITGSITDETTEMSQQERLFLQNVEEHVQLKDGHYEIPLPLEDRQVPVPNNRT